MPRPIRVVVIAVAALGLLAACGGDDGTSGATTTSTAPTGDRATFSERAEIVEAYEDHWVAFYRYLNNDGGGEPIGNYFAGERRDDLPGQVADFAGRGLEVRGVPDSDVGLVLVDGERASLVDCQIDRTYAVDKRTSALVIPESTVPQRVDAVLVHDDSGWKVSSVVYGPDGSCTR